MATSSTIPDVCDALVRLLRAALPGVQVSDGRPANAQIQRECVYLDNVDGDSSLPVMRSGRKSRQEDYSLEVVCYVAGVRGDLSVARRRGSELRDAVCDALVNDTSLGSIDGVQQAVPGSFRQALEYLDEGPVCLTVTEVEVKSRIN